MPECRARARREGGARAHGARAARARRINDARARGGGRRSRRGRRRRAARRARERRPVQRRAHGARDARARAARADGRRPARGPRALRRARDSPAEFERLSPAELAELLPQIPGADLGALAGFVEADGLSGAALLALGSVDDARAALPSFFGAAGAAAAAPAAAERLLEVLRRDVKTPSSNLQKKTEALLARALAADPAARPASATRASTCSARSTRAAAT